MPSVFSHGPITRIIAFLSKHLSADSIVEVAGSNLSTFLLTFVED
jgi:hypothetical protein